MALHSDIYQQTRAGLGPLLEWFVVRLLTSFDNVPRSRFDFGLLTSDPLFIPWCTLLVDQGSARHPCLAVPFS